MASLSHSLIKAGRVRIWAQNNSHSSACANNAFSLRAIFKQQRCKISMHPMLGVAGCSIGTAVVHYWTPPTNCERSHAVSESRETPEVLILAEPYRANSRIRRILDKIRRTFHVLVRLLGLTFSLAPIALLYPMFLIAQESQENLKHQDAQDILLWAKEQDQKQLSDENSAEWKAKVRRFYFETCLKCAERSGAVVIKLMQWAGSRPDLFGQDFCSVFSRLQDHTTPHPWKHTEQLMKEAYGDDWETRIQLRDILGSGCIGQVYRGTILSKDGVEERHVAVKVLHPTVEATINADLDLLRFAAYLRQSVEGPSWLDWRGMVEEFARLLKTQLDLRVEGANLVKFAKNFEDVKEVEFPGLIPEFPVDKNVLVETLLDGIPVMEYARQNRDDRSHLNTLCRMAIQSVCKMIFVDNFLHGDLHPGNVFVARDGSKFYLFDAGIATEYTDHDHEAIVSVLGAFIRRNGQRAGELLVDGNLNHGVVDAEGFIRKISDLTEKATSRDNYLMQNLGVYISYICKAAADHHVHVIPSFISAALAVKVQEGIAIALDPSLSIIQVATPIVIQSEARRQLDKTQRKLVRFFTKMSS